MDEQRTPHCEPGCVFCEMDGQRLFEYRIREWKAALNKSAVHEHVRSTGARRTDPQMFCEFNPTPRIP